MTKEGQNVIKSKMNNSHPYFCTRGSSECETKMGVKIALSFVECRPLCSTHNI